MRALRALRRHSPRRRGIQYAAPHRCNHVCLGVLDRPPSRTMTVERADRGQRRRHNCAALTCCMQPPQNTCGPRQGS
ncbi:hypothetical protein C7G41_21380 [Bradyrhizobium sp. MOS002]|nr:hypothetical protein C7G41_21380 [Bradyrhizobium sp. MOS002]